MKKVLLVIGVVMSLFAGTASANYVLNPGFELPAGDPCANNHWQDWFHSSLASVVSDNGPSASGIWAVSWTNTAPRSVDIRSKAISVTPGEVYSFGLDYKTSADATGKFLAQVRWHQSADLNGNALGWISEYTAQLGNSGGSWTTFSIGDVGAVPENAAYCDIRIRTSATSPSGNTFVGQLSLDNIRFVPEPATLALLSLGGLLLRKRN